MSDPADPDNAPHDVVTTLLRLAGLEPSAEEVAAMVRGYPDRRAALDAMYVPEADDEPPAPAWLYRDGSS